MKTYEIIIKGIASNGYYTEIIQADSERQAIQKIKDSVGLWDIDIVEVIEIG